MWNPARRVASPVEDAAQALNWTCGVVTKLELTLKEAKTSIKEACKESFSLHFRFESDELSL